MNYHRTGPSNLDKGDADQGIRVPTVSPGRHARISEEQLAAAERTRQYHVNKLAVYRASTEAMMAAKLASEGAGAQAS